MKTENPITPVFGTDEEARVAPKYEMPEGLIYFRLWINYTNGRGSRLLI